MDNHDCDALSRMDGGNALLVKQTEFAKNLFLQTDFAMTRHKQLEQMKVEDSQSNVSSLNACKAFQEIEKRVSNDSKLQTVFDGILSNAKKQVFESRNKLEKDKKMTNCLKKEFWNQTIL